MTTSKPTALTALGAERFGAFSTDLDDLRGQDLAGARVAQLAKVTTRGFHSDGTPASPRDPGQA